MIDLSSIDVSAFPHWLSPGGEVLLINADCMAVLPLLPAESVDLCVTSPPYNQLSSIPKKGSGMWGNSNGGSGFVRAWAESSYPDEIEESEYQHQQNSLFDSSCFSKTSSLFYNHQIRWRDGVCLHPVQWFAPRGWNLRQEIIWDRAGGMMMNAKMFCRFDERVLWFVRGSRWEWNQEFVGLGTIWRIARFQQQQGKEHPVAFPIEIPARCIMGASLPSQTILDPFAGSFTTAVACIRTGRQCIAIEIEPKYFAIGKRRCEEALAIGSLFDPAALAAPNLFEETQ